MGDGRANRILAGDVQIGDFVFGDGKVIAVERDGDKVRVTTQDAKGGTKVEEYDADEPWDSFR